MFTSVVISFYKFVVSFYTQKLIVCCCTCEGTDFGGSIRMVGSHSPGGSTVTWSKNSSIPANKSPRSLALYATSWNTFGNATTANVYFNFVTVHSHPAKSGSECKNDKEVKKIK